MFPVENEAIRFLRAVRAALPGRRMLHIDELYRLARTRHNSSFAYEIVANDPDDSDAIEALRRRASSLQDEPRVLVMVCKDNPEGIDA
jgi:hypothetical protein